MRLLPNVSIETFSLTISYHAICVSTHINVVLHSSSEQKRLMNDVHANKYILIYVMRYLSSDRYHDRIH